MSCKSQRLDVYRDRLFNFTKHRKDPALLVLLYAYLDEMEYRDLDTTQINSLKVFFVKLRSYFETAEKVDYIPIEKLFQKAINGLIKFKILDETQAKAFIKLILLKVVMPQCRNYGLEQMEAVLKTMRRFGIRTKNPKSALKEKLTERLEQIGRNGRSLLDVYADLFTWE